MFFSRSQAMVEINARRRISSRSSTASSRSALRAAGASEKVYPRSLFLYVLLFFLGGRGACCSGAYGLAWAGACTWGVIHVLSMYVCAIFPRKKHTILTIMFSKLILLERGITSLSTKKAPQMSQGKLPRSSPLESAVPLRAVRTVHRHHRLGETRVCTDLPRSMPQGSGRPRRAAAIYSIPLMF